MNSHIKVDKVKRVIVERCPLEALGGFSVEIRVEHEDGSITDLTAHSTRLIAVEVDREEVPE